MPIPRPLCVALRSLLALVLAIAAIPAVNLVGAWVSEHVFRLPAGGDLTSDRDRAAELMTQARADMTAALDL